MTENKDTGGKAPFLLREHVGLFGIAAVFAVMLFFAWRGMASIDPDVQFQCLRVLFTFALSGVFAFLCSAFRSWRRSRTGGPAA